MELAFQWGGKAEIIGNQPNVQHSRVAIAKERNKADEEPGGA